MHTLLRASLVFAVASTLFACKPKPAEVPVAEAEATEEEETAVTETMVEACRIKLSEPEALEWTTYWEAASGPNAGPSPSSAQSFHWADADEKKLLIQRDATAPLSIVCGGDSPAVYVSLSAFNSGEQTIPMDAGEYPIVGKVEGEVPPGQFQAGPILAGERRLEPTSGTLQIDRFDTSGVRGAFRIQGTVEGTDGEEFNLEGSFDIPCRGDSMESLCEADKTVGGE
jgi:hypothetical protein